jgi:hypothetical protein
VKTRGTLVAKLRTKKREGTSGSKGMELEAKLSLMSYYLGKEIGMKGQGEGGATLAPEVRGSGIGGAILLNALARELGATTLEGNLEPYDPLGSTTHATVPEQAESAPKVKRAAEASGLERLSGPQQVVASVNRSVHNRKGMGKVLWEKAMQHRAMLEGLHGGLNPIDEEVGEVFTEGSKVEESGKVPLGTETVPPPLGVTSRPTTARERLAAALRENKQGDYNGKWMEWGRRMDAGEPLVPEDLITMIKSMEDDELWADRVVKAAVAAPCPSEGQGRHSR